MGTEVFDDVAFYFVLTSILLITLIPTTIYLIVALINDSIRVSKPQDPYSTNFSTKQYIQSTLTNNGIKTSTSYTLQFISSWKGIIFIIGWIITLYMLILLPSIQTKKFATFEPYSILGIELDSSLAVIRRSYRKLSLLYHPDKNVNNKQEAAEKFQLVAKAYAALTDPRVKANMQKYGNPDGFKGFSLTYGLPTFLIEKKNEIYILCSYLFLFLILPSILFLWWYRYSNQYIYGISENNFEYLKETMTDIMTSIEKKKIDKSMKPKPKLKIYKSEQKQRQQQQQQQLHHQQQQSHHHEKDNSSYYIQDIWYYIANIPTFQGIFQSNTTTEAIYSHVETLYYQTSSSKPITMIPQKSFSSKYVQLLLYSYLTGTLNNSTFLTKSHTQSSSIQSSKIPSHLLPILQQHLRLILTQTHKILRVLYEFGKANHQFEFVVTILTYMQILSQGIHHTDFLQQLPHITPSISTILQQKYHISRMEDLIAILAQIPDENECGDEDKGEEGDKNIDGNNNVNIKDNKDDKDDENNGFQFKNKKSILTYRQHQRQLILTEFQWKNEEIIDILSTYRCISTLQSSTHIYVPGSQSITTDDMITFEVSLAKTTIQDTLQQDIEEKIDGYNVNNTYSRLKTEKILQKQAQTRDRLVTEFTIPHHLSQLRREMKANPEDSTKRDQFENNMKDAIQTIVKPLKSASQKQRRDQKIGVGESEINHLEKEYMDQNPIQVAISTSLYDEKKSTIKQELEQKQGMSEPESGCEQYIYSKNSLVPIKETWYILFCIITGDNKQYLADVKTITSPSLIQTQAEAEAEVQVQFIMKAPEAEGVYAYQIYIMNNGYISTNKFHRVFTYVYEPQNAMLKDIEIYTQKLYKRYCQDAMVRYFALKQHRDEISQLSNLKEVENDHTNSTNDSQGKKFLQSLLQDNHTDHVAVEDDYDKEIEEKEGYNITPENTIEEETRNVMDLIDSQLLRDKNRLMSCTIQDKSDFKTVIKDIKITKAINEINDKIDPILSTIASTNIRNFYTNQQKNVEIDAEIHDADDDELDQEISIEEEGKWYYLGATSFSEMIINIAVISVLAFFAYNWLEKHGHWQKYIAPPLHLFTRNIIIITKPLRPYITPILKLYQDILENPSIIALQSPENPFYILLHNVFTNIKGIVISVSGVGVSPVELDEF